jgi:hypothetical protein
VEMPGTLGVSKVSVSGFLSLPTGWSNTSKVDPPLERPAASRVLSTGWDAEGGWRLFLERRSRRRRPAEVSPRSSPLASRRASRNDLSLLGTPDGAATWSDSAPGRSPRPCLLDATYHPSAALVAGLVSANSPQFAPRVLPEGYSQRGLPVLDSIGWPLSRLYDFP